jgi:hypothetical protein
MSNDLSFLDLEDEAEWKAAPAIPVPPADMDPDLAAISGGTGLSEATEARYHEKCDKCGGTGRFIGWSGRILGDCFRCKGTGILKYRTSPETRAEQRRRRVEAKVTRATTWQEEHPAEWEYMQSRAPRWEFMASLQAQMLQRGSLSDKQLAAIRRAMQRDEARDAERKAQAKAEGSDLDLTDLPAGRYAVPGGDTRLKVLVQRPGKDNRWAGWIFVSDAAVYGERQRYGRQPPGGAYTGKVQDALRAIMDDPKAASAAYGHLTSTCGVCGRPLEDEESVARGIGPVCAQKF